jgi:CRP-like cAMP-binding protein
LISGGNPIHMPASGYQIAGIGDLPGNLRDEAAMSVRADAQTLGSIPVFEGCEPVHLQLLAFASERQSFREGDAIVQQGQQATAAFLILNGEAELRTGRGSSQQAIGTAGPGAFLGEIAMIGQAPYSITAVATSTVSTARIDTKLFLRVADEYPEFGKAVFANLARKLGQSVRDLDKVRAQLESGKSFSDL